MNNESREQPTAVNAGWKSGCHILNKAPEASEELRTFGILSEYEAEL